MKKASLGKAMWARPKHKLEGVPERVPHPHLHQALPQIHRPLVHLPPLRGAPAEEKTSLEKEEMLEEVMEGEVAVTAAGALTEEETIEEAEVVGTVAIMIDITIKDTRVFFLTV